MSPFADPRRAFLLLVAALLWSRGAASATGGPVKIVPVSVRVPVAARQAAFVAKPAWSPPHGLPGLPMFPAPQGGSVDAQAAPAASLSPEISGIPPAAAAKGAAFGDAGTAGRAALEGLRWASDEAVRPYADPVAALGLLFEGRTLRLAGGGSLEAEAALTQRRQAAALSATHIPEGGILVPLSRDAAFELWPRDLGTQLDVVVLGSDGEIRTILNSVRPSSPATPWTRVPLVSLRGEQLLLLPAGKADRLGLREGETIEGTGLRAPPGPETMARAMLEGGAPGRGALLEYFRENPSSYGLFDSALGSARRSIRAARLSGASALAGSRKRALDGFLDGLFRSERLGGSFIGVASWHFPRAWLRSLRGRAFVVELAMGRKSGEWRVPLLAVELAKLPSRLARVFIHESGHFLAARLLGLPVGRFRVFPAGGGYISVEAPGGWRSAAVFLAGPLLQLVVGTALAVLGAAAVIGGAAWGAMAALLGALWAYRSAESGSSDLPRAVASLGLKRLGRELACRWPRFKSS